MMEVKREIKFRAKIAEDIEALEMKSGYWFDGHYVREGNQHFIVVDDEYQMYLKIFPETLGQFTGLYGKDNREIYEGDIVQAYHLTRNIPSRVGEIKFIEGSFCFCYDNIQIPLIGLYCNKLEVIGNIHDNPELHIYRG